MFQSPQKGERHGRSSTAAMKAQLGAQCGRRGHRRAGNLHGERLPAIDLSHADLHAAAENGSLADIRPMTGTLS